MKLVNKLLTITESKKKIIEKIKVVLMTQGIVFLSSIHLVLAVEDGTDGLDNFETILCAWIQRIGVVAAILGGAMFAWSLASQDAERKIQALWVVAAGMFAVAVGKYGPSIFG